MGRRADQPAARPHDQRLDRQGGRGASRRGSSGSARCRCMCRRSRSRELERCMRELAAARVSAISTMAGGLELGDPQLAPFWAKAEALGAVVYIHPGGNRDRRFKRFHLWNSVGQAFEEAMAISSLMYDGVLERLPQAQNLHLPRRRLYAVLHGPHRSQLRREGQYAREHEQAADRLSAHALFRFLRLRAGRCCSISSTKWARTGCCSARTIRWARRNRSNSSPAPKRCRTRRKEQIVAPTRRRCSGWRTSRTDGGRPRRARSATTSVRDTAWTNGFSIPSRPRELERRWAAARKDMAERRIDALVMQNNNDWLGGYVRWFTDTPPEQRLSAQRHLPGLRPDDRGRHGRRGAGVASSTATTRPTAASAR